MNHQIPAQTVNTRRGADLGNGAAQALVQPDLTQASGGPADALGFLQFPRLPIAAKAARIALESQTTPDDFVAQLRIAQRQHLGRDAETIEELRPQLPLLGIHRAHQDKPSRVGK
jgi:hypothetical protein